MNIPFTSLGILKNGNVSLIFFRFLNLFYCQNSAFPEELFWSLMEKIGTALCSAIFIMDKKVKLRISIKFSVSNRNMCSESL